MRLIRIGGESPETFAVDSDNVVLGRAPARGLKIVDGTISREHARLFLRDGAWNVADLNSSNGTFVNGARVSRAAIKAGDVLMLGSVELRFEEDATTTGDAGPPAPAEGEITLENAESLFETTIAPARAAAAPLASPPPRAPARPVSEKPLLSRAASSSTKSSGKTSVLRADLSQYGFLPRLLLVLVALALAYGAFTFVSRVTEDAVPDGAAPGATSSGDGATPDGPADGK